ncbi:hypothetical protein FRB98_006924 [Tulasnella sp. 332]|nr:hypothetical protein FRB98_006924 [Tulasnella sp. 332]
MDFGQGAAGKGGSGYLQLMILAFGVCSTNRRHLARDICLQLPLHFLATMGQVIAGVSPIIKLAPQINPPMALILTNFASVTILYPQLTKL